jgi:hypothetical protein
MTETPLADPALYGLEDRVPGSPCNGGRHDEYYCQQITLGRDVSEYRPDIRMRHETDLHAARAPAERGLFGAWFSTPEDGGNLFDEEPGSFGHGVPWRARVWLWMRGRVA